MAIIYLTATENIFSGAAMVARLSDMTVRLARAGDESKAYGDREPVIGMAAKPFAAGGIVKWDALRPTGDVVFSAEQSNV